MIRVPSLFGLQRVYSRLTGLGSLFFAGAMSSDRTKTLQNTTATLAELETAETLTGAKTFSATANFSASLIVGTDPGGPAAIRTGGSIQATDLASVIGVTGNQQLFTIGVSSTQRWTLVRDTANRLITYVDMTGVGGSAGAIQTALSTGETGFGVTPTASNGLLQLASGTTPAFGYACGTDTHWYRDSAGSWSADSNIKVATVGKGLYVKEGTNATMGSAALVAGSVVISTTKVTAASRIFLTSQVDGGTVGFLRVSARTAGTSFTITSSSAADTSTIAWIILEPA